MDVVKVSTNSQTELPLKETSMRKCLGKTWPNHIATLHIYIQLSYLNNIELNCYNTIDYNLTLDYMNQSLWFQV